MGREGEREGEKHQCMAASRTPPTGDLACNPGMRPDWESNWQPFGLQAGAQSTEPYQPGQIIAIVHGKCMLQRRRGIPPGGTGFLEQKIFG